jgi:hypothetical protein
MDVEGIPGQSSGSWQQGVNMPPGARGACLGRGSPLTEQKPYDC